MGHTGNKEGKSRAAIDPFPISEERDMLESEPKHKIAQCALRSSNMKSVSTDPDRITCNPFRFNVELPENVKVTNQHRSGRCWIFAGLNVLRHLLIREYNLSPDFELSQAYMYKCNMYEKCNVAFETMYEHRCEKERRKKQQQQQQQHQGVGASSESDDILFKKVLMDCFEDGGTSVQFVNLVKKYGVVPKDAFPDTYQVNDTAMLRTVLKALVVSSYDELKRALRSVQGRKKTQTQAQAQADDSGADSPRRCFEDFKANKLKECAKVLTLCIGSTPPSILWDYCKDGEQEEQEEGKEKKEKKEKKKEQRGGRGSSEKSRARAQTDRFSNDEHEQEEEAKALQKQLCEELGGLLRCSSKAVAKCCSVTDARGFYEERVKPMVDVATLVPVKNDPRYAFDILLATPYGHNVMPDNDDNDDSEPFTVFRGLTNYYLNVGIDDLRAGVKKMIKDLKMPVWFASNFDEFILDQHSFMDPDASILYDGLFDIEISSECGQKEKAILLESEIVTPAHAMVVTGYYEDPCTGQITRWKIENSHGSSDSMKHEGFLVMSDRFFRRSVSQAILHPSCLTKKQHQVFENKSDVKILSYPTAVA